MIDLFTFLVIFAAMLIRTLTGFGSALVAIPLLAIPLGARFAVPFIMIYECLIDIMILAKERSSLKADVVRAWPLLAAGLMGVPIGAEILMLSSDRLLKIGIGVVLIVFSIMVLQNASPNILRYRSGSAAAGFLGGLLCGSVGLPGPPMALLLSGRGLEKGEFRRLIVVFLTAVDFLTFGYYMWVGLITVDMLISGLKFIPAMVLGFLAGSFAFGRVNEALFRRLALGITLMAGVLLLWSTANSGSLS